MTEEAPPDTKRRRLSAVDGPHQDAMCLTDLPSGILALAASFLAAPSRALFVIALDENSAVMPSERSSAIVGNEWDVLDFGGIEKELAAKLTDLDIERVLQCVDAANKLERLKLTNCTNITGTCLEPLRGSSIIEQIDLSLVGYNQNPDLDPVPPISLDHVLSILDSIIETEDCFLMHLQFPSVWRKEASPDSDFDAFIVRYNEMRRNRGEVYCWECNRRLPGGTFGEWIETDTDSLFYGNQTNTCYNCLKNYCYTHFINGEEQKSMIKYCFTCRREYCIDCMEMTLCSGCDTYYCNDCHHHNCHSCTEAICSPCVEENHQCYECTDCRELFCSGCENEEGGIGICDQCPLICCRDCRWKRFRQRRNLDCEGCKVLREEIL